MCLPSRGAAPSANVYITVRQPQAGQTPRGETRGRRRFGKWVQARGEIMKKKTKEKCLDETV